MHAWSSPHSFALFAVDTDEHVLPPLDVVTYGPLAADLTVLAKPTTQIVIQLGRTMGFEWLLSLVLTPDRLEKLPEPELARYLRDRYALKPGVRANPFNITRGELRRPRAQPLPLELIAGFVTAERGRLAEIGQTLVTLCKPLLHAAEDGKWQVDGEDDRAALLFNAFSSSLKLTRVTSAGGRTQHLLQPTDLYGRALLEIVDIYDTRPPLAICPDCQRLFIPNRPEQQRCRRHLWLTDTGEPLTTCTTRHTSTTAAKLDGAARRRDYKKHEMRVRRSRDRLGPDHPDTQQARRDFLEWQQEHPAPIGRPMTPTAIGITVDNLATK